MIRLLAILSCLVFSLNGIANSAQGVYSTNVTISGKSTHQRVYTDYCKDANTITCYRFNDDLHDTALSSKNNDHLFKAGGGTYVTNGKEGNAWDFESSESNFINNTSISSDFALTSNVTPTSACFWIKPESFGAGDFSNNIFWVGGSDGWGMACGNSPNVVITYTSGGNSGGIESNMDTGTWYHFCTVFDQSNNILKIYKNGLSIFSNSSYTDNSAIIAGDDIYIGANGASTNFFDGIIDELIFTHDVLTPAEVLDIFENGLR